MGGIITTGMMDFVECGPEQVLTGLEGRIMMGWKFKKQIFC